MNRQPGEVDRSGCTAQRHSDRIAYSLHGCTCDDSREDARLYYKRGREGRRPPGLFPVIGVTRRLQALAVMGHADDVVLRSTGLSQRTVTRLRDGLVDVVQRGTFEQVALAFRELIGVVPPDTWQVRRRCRLARGRGWAGPAEWIDIDDPNEQPAIEPVEPDDQPDAEVVRRLVARQRQAGATKADRRAAAQILWEQDDLFHDITIRTLRCGWTQLRRWAAEFEAEGSAEQTTEETEAA